MANVGFVVEMSIFYVYSLTMAFTEETPINLKPNLMKVYELESTNILLSITKSVVGLAMFLRGATVYFYIGTLACMFIPVITNSHPYFYVPWLLVALFRCVVFNLFLLMSGFCVCVIFSPIKPACMEFIFIKMLESFIYSYFWLKINRKYVELCRQTGIKYVPFLRHFQSRAEFLSQEVTYRRRRLRTLGNRVPPPPSNRPPPPCVSVDDLDCSSDSDYSLSSLRDSEMTKGSRSLDSLFTKATMDWFIKEALVHQSVEKDDARYEEGLAKRAATFLQRTLGQKPRSARSDEFEVITNLLPLHTTQRYDPTQDEETPVIKETRVVGNREVYSRDSESTCVEEEIPLTTDGKTLDTCFDDSNSCVENAVEEGIPSAETENPWCENGFTIGHGKNPFVEEEGFRPVFGAYDSVGLETTLRSGKDGSDDVNCSDDESLCPTGKFFGSPACLHQKVPLFDKELDVEKENSDPDDESHKCPEIERSKSLVDRNSAFDTTECGQLQSPATRNTDDGNESSCTVMKNEALRVNQDPPSDKGPAGSHSQSRENEIDGQLVAKLIIKSSVGAMHGANQSSIGSFTEAGLETKSCDSSISPDILTLDRILAVVNEAQTNHECLNANNVPADERDLLNYEDRLTNPSDKSSEVRKVEPLEDGSESSSVSSHEKSSSDGKIKCQDDRWILCTNELSSVSPTSSLSSGTLTPDKSKTVGADESFEDGSFSSTPNDEQLAVKKTSGENWESKFEQSVPREGVMLETIMWRGNPSSFNCATSSTSSVFSQGMTQTVLMHIMGEHVKSEEQIGSLDCSDSNESDGYQVSVIDLANCSDYDSINNVGIKHRVGKFLPNTRTLEESVRSDSKSTSRNMNFSEETSMDHSTSLDRTGEKRLEIPEVELGTKIDSCRCCLNCEHDESMFFSTGSRTNSSTSRSIEYTHHGADFSEYTSLVSEESANIYPSRFYSSGKNAPDEFSIDDSFESNTNSGKDEETSINSATPEIPSIYRNETSGRTSTQQFNKSGLIEKSSTSSQANSIDQSAEEYTKLPCKLINNISVTEETVSVLNDVSAMVRTSGSTDVNKKSNSGVEKGSMVELNYSNAHENVYDCTTSILESYDVPELTPETLTKKNSNGTVNQLIRTSTSATSFPNKSVCETIRTTHFTTLVEKCPEVQDGNISAVDFVRESDPVENRWVLSPQSSNSKSQNFVCSSSFVEPLLTKTPSTLPHGLFNENVSHDDNILYLNTAPLTFPLQPTSTKLPDSVAAADECNSTANPQSGLHSSHSINTVKGIVTSEADSKTDTMPDTEVLRILRKSPEKSSKTDMKASQIEFNAERNLCQKLINKVSATACKREDSTEASVTQQFKLKVLPDPIQYPPELPVSMIDSVESQILEPEYNIKRQYLQSEKQSSEGINHQLSSHNAPCISTTGATLIENCPSINGVDSLNNKIIQNSVEKVTGGNDPVLVTQMPACLFSAKEASTDESETCKETEIKDVELKVRQNLSDDESLLQGTLISIHGALADRLITEKVFQSAPASDIETPGSNDETAPEKGITGTDACVTNKSSTEIPPMFVRKTSTILMNGKSSEKSAPTNDSAFAESPLVTSSLSRPGRVYEERERLVSGGCLSSDNPSTVMKRSKVNFVLSFENKPESPPPVAAPPPGVFQRLMAKFSSPPGPPIVKETLRKFNAMSAGNSLPTTNQSQRRSSVESKEWASNNSLGRDGARRPSKISEKASLFDKLAIESCSSGKSPKISPRGSRNSITSNAVLKSIKSLEKSSTIGRVVTVERKFPENIPSSEVFRSARAKFSSQPVGSSRSNVTGMTSEIKCNPSVNENSKDRQTDVMSFSTPTCETSASLSETEESTRQTKIPVKSDGAIDDVFEKDKSCPNTKIDSHSSECSNVKIMEYQENNLGVKSKSNDSCGTAQKKFQVSPACSTVIEGSSGFIDSGGQKAEALHSTRSGREVESAPKKTDDTSQPQNLLSTSREEVKQDSTTSSKIHEEDGL